jgi:Cu2+-exporting ATPase
MEVGALLMSLSTIVVAVNAQLLRRLDLSPGAGIAAAHAATDARVDASQGEPSGILRS